MSTNAFCDYYRCPQTFGDIIVAEGSGQSGFFQFGNAICYGRTRCPAQPKLDSVDLYDALPHTCIRGGRTFLPFDPTEVINNLRLERYVPARKIFPNPLAQHAYYISRSFIPEKLRWWLQRYAYAGWDRIRFPHWPVDTTADNILQTLCTLALEASGRSKLPFIWFWPDGYSAAACMTHDVESTVGLEFCSALMDLDDTFGIKSSFQLVPTERYRTSAPARTEMQQRGFEVNLHGLNHDGRLFIDRRTFVQRAKIINSYANEFGASGFRSGTMYRNQDWYDNLHFAYDMSVPNVAHLEPQQGGCCTVMPYFVGKMLVLPLTTTQDFALFHVLRDYSTGLWEQQLSSILQNNGLATFISHPDYLRGQPAQHVYKELLSQLSALRAKDVLWIALPGEINRWWRQRSCMQLVENDGIWRVIGAGSERARVAYATLDHGRLHYEVHSNQGQTGHEAGFVPDMKGPAATRTWNTE